MNIEKWVEETFRVEEWLGLWVGILLSFIGLFSPWYVLSLAAGIFFPYRDVDDYS